MRRYPAHYDVTVMYLYFLKCRALTIVTVTAVLSSRGGLQNLYIPIPIDRERLLHV